MEAQEARERTPEQHWEMIERVQEMLPIGKDVLAGECPETHGLVEQLRVFPGSIPGAERGPDGAETIRGTVAAD